MSDWADRKERSLAGRAAEEERDRQKQSQILASARPFWEDMIDSMTKSKDAWNSKRGKDEIFILKPGGLTDTLGLIVRGRDDEVTIELHYNIPQIRYSVQSTQEKRTLQFDLDFGEIQVYYKGDATKRYNATRAADFFLDKVVRG